MISRLVVLFWCGLLCVASGTAPSAPVEAKQEKTLRFDPEFKPWFKDDSPPNFELLVGALKRTLDSFERRLGAFRGNVDVILEYRSKADSSRLESWLANIYEHNLILSNRYATLRHQTIILYTLYMNGELVKLLQYEFNIDSILQAERKYFEQFERLKVVFDDDFTGPANDYIEKIPTWGGLTIRTWIQKLNERAHYSFPFASTFRVELLGVLEHISRLLYWREVAAARKHHAMYHGLAEEIASRAPRDRLIERQITILEGMIAQELEMDPFKRALPLLEVTDSYVRTFVERASALGYGPEAQEKVTSIGVLRPANIIEFTTSLSYDSNLLRFRSRARTLFECHERSLAEKTIKLLAAAYQNHPQSISIAAPVSEEANMLNEATLLVELVHDLAYFHILGRLLGRQLTEPSCCLDEIWNLENGTILAPSCNQNVLQCFSERYGGYRDSYPYLFTEEYKATWPQPRTLDDVSIMAQSITTSLREWAARLLSETGSFVKSEWLGDAEIFLRYSGIPWGFKSLFEDSDLVPESDTNRLSEAVSSVHIN